MRKSTIAVVVAVCALAAGAAKVSNVKVTAMDGFGGDAQAALARCQTKSGTDYDPVVVSRDVASLKDSGAYQDVVADAHLEGDGVEVVFKVYRKMRFCGPLVVKGAEQFGASKIAAEAGLKDGLLYGEAELAEAAAKVREFYVKKNFPSAKVVPVPKMMPDGLSCTVAFEIEEGAKIKIKNFTFDGLETIEEDVLREAIGVYPWWNPVGWFAEDISSAGQFAAAVNKAVAKCRDLGYLDAEVMGPRYIYGDDGCCDTVEFSVVEGPRYKVGSVKIEGITRYSTEAVAGKSDLPAAGSVAGATALDEAAHRIAVQMGSGDIGLADTRVDVKYVPREDDDATLDVTFEVSEGTPVVIDRILVEGNDYTKDKVIRREIPLSPGNRMLADRAEQGKKRLENLNYFSRVSYSLNPSGRGKDANGAEYRDLIYKVEEKNTGSFMVGVGASSVDHVYVSAELQQSNFDLFAPSKLFRGGGQKGRLYVAAGPRIQTYEASITEPHFMDRYLELEVNAYRRQRWYDEYDIIRTGAGASLSYPVKFWPTWETFGRFGVRLSGEFIEFDDPEHGYWLYKGKAVSLAEKGGEEDRYGDAFEGVARVFWSRNTTDSHFIPKTGSRSHLYFDLAGGDNEYWRLGASHRSYFNVWERYGHVLMAGLRVETIDALSGGVPIYDRLFLGGPRSVRGIEYRNVSPMARRIRGRDKDGDLSGDWMPWGGQTLFCANFEYTVPIVKMLRLAAFTDMGCVGEDEFDFDFSDTFAWSVGLGVRLDIPMFPIRLDFATPIEKPDHADKEVFSFSIGYDF